MPQTILETVGPVPASMRRTSVYICHDIEVYGCSSEGDVLQIALTLSCLLFSLC